MQVLLQFRFKIAKLPQVEFFYTDGKSSWYHRWARLSDVPTPLYDYPMPGDKITYQSLDISFLVDENLNNYKELHDWLIGLGFPSNHQQFADIFRATGTDRFPGNSINYCQVSGTATPAPIPEGRYILRRYIDDYEVK